MIVNPESTLDLKRKKYFNDIKTSTQYVIREILFIKDIFFLIIVFSNTAFQALVITLPNHITKEMQLIQKQFL